MRKFLFKNLSETKRKQNLQHIIWHSGKLMMFCPSLIINLLTWNMNNTHRDFLNYIFTCGKYLHNRIISLKGEEWVHKTSFTLPLFYSKIQKRERVVMYMCARGTDFLFVSSIFRLDFGIFASTVVPQNFFSFH